MAVVKIDANRVLSTLDPKLFGHFTEHAFGNIYHGMYDPDSEFADEDGFRTDVIEAMKQVKTPLLRYPGGNFVSNYHWEDGIGPKEQRKRVFEYAWLTEESNQFGTVDFIKLCRKVGAEPLICLNMGTGTVQEAMNWVEYCNGTGNTYYANLRRSHGYEEPFHVKYWGLGNEMYGLWQMNHKSAEDYAKAALEFAKAIKWVDPTIKLIACGYEQSSDWNYTVMKEIGELVDYISAHHYAIGWGPFENNYLADLYIPEYMKRLTDLTLASVYCGMNDVTDVKVAWDEWNMFGWVGKDVNDDSTYNLHNAIVTALILNMFIKNSDKIGMANYSTFVNINGAVSTHKEGIVKRAQFHTFDLYANNVGKEVYDVKVDSDQLELKVVQSTKIGRPSLNIDLTSDVENQVKTVRVHVIDCVATGTEDGTCYITVVNKHPDKAVETIIEVDGFGDFGVEKTATIYHDDLNAGNTLDNPDEVKITEGFDCVCESGVIKATLKKHSINLIKIVKK